MRLLLRLLLVLLPCVVAAAEPLLKQGDVIAFIGGEDLVVAAEDGALEAIIQSAMPGAQLKFRSFAREGDTVFEQRRDLNYPTLETQLEKAGATVVLAQFGGMESRRKGEPLAAFVAAYEKLIGRMQGPGKRRVILIEPVPGFEATTAYSVAIRELASRLGCGFIPLSAKESPFPGNGLRGDGTHLSAEGQWFLATQAAGVLIGSPVAWGNREQFRAQRGGLQDAVAARNGSWFHYSRPQNWAFLAGDRTNQPSSRDHVDRNKRWFPEEMEHFIPLIEAQEKQIWEIAAQPKR